MIRKKKFLFSILFVLILSIVSGCEDSTTILETKESAEEFRTVIDSFTDKVDEMQLEEKISDVGDKVVEGVSTAATDAFKLLDDTSDNTVPVAKSGASLIKVKVTNVVDGDTVDVKILDSNSKSGLNKEERVRFILVNTPESKGDYANNPQPYSKEAEAFTMNVLKDKTVWLELDEQERDKYGRLLAYIWLNSISYEYLGEKHTFENITINELLLIEGLAKVAVYPPNTQYINHFKELELTAKKESVGLWTIE